MATTPTSPIHKPRAAASPSLSDRAYDAIRGLIVTLGLPPGAVVSERELQERLGLGRTPVREALRDLARDQLVEVYPRRGIVVSGVDAGDLAELSEVRVMLESQAARLAAIRREPQDLAETIGLLDELARLPGAHDERQLIELDQRIHRHVYRCAHNAFLEETLERHYVLTLRIWHLALDRVDCLHDAVDEHRELLEAIRDGEGARAAAVMRAHVVAFERSMRTVL